MELSAAKTKLILRQIGRAEDLALQDLVPAIVEDYQDKAQLSPRLLPLYVKREFIKTLLGDNWEAVNYKDGDEAQSDSDKSDHLHKLLANVEREIAEVEEAVFSGVFATGDLITTSTVPAPSCGPDPSERAFAGDPLRRTAFLNQGW